MYISGILDHIDRDNNKYPYIKEMASLPNMKDDDLFLISLADSDSLKIISDLSKQKTDKGKEKYSSGDLSCLASNLDAKGLNDIKPMLNTSMTVQQIVNLSEFPINFEKLSEKVNSMEKIIGSENLNQIVFYKDDYEPENNYVLKGKNTNGNSCSELLDKNMKSLALEQVEHYSAPSGKYYTTVKTNDYRNNTTSQVRQYLDEDYYPIVESEVRIIKDKNGKKLKTEYMTLSDVQGVYNAKTVYPDGREEITSSGKMDKKTGIVSVKQDMKSLDGTKTQYLYENDPQGNRIIDYKITDKNGKKLLDYSQSFEVLDDNHFVSSKNGKVYEMALDEDKNILTVKNRKTKEENQIKLKTFVMGDKKSMINLLKKFPGEELIKLKDTTNFLKGIEKIDDCSFSPKSKTISVMDNLYSALHELGHAKDNKEKMDEITNRKDVQKVYDKERKAFNKAFPNAQKDHINYFIDKQGHYGGEKGGLEETVAESNALLNSYNNVLDLASRAHYLRQYFPQTIAKLAECLSE